MYQSKHSNFEYKPITNDELRTLIGNSDELKRVYLLGANDMQEAVLDLRDIYEFGDGDIFEDNGELWEVLLFRSSSEILTEVNAYLKKVNAFKPIIGDVIEITPVHDPLINKKFPLLVTGFEECDDGLGCCNLWGINLINGQSWEFLHIKTKDLVGTPIHLDGFRDAMEDALFEWRHTPESDFSKKCKESYKKNVFRMNVSNAAEDGGEEE